MNILKYFILLFVVVLNGCLFSRGTEYNFPRDIRHMAQNEMKSAKRCIESQGLSLSERADKLTVRKIPGQRKFREGWGWRAPEFNNTWVLGLAWEHRNGTYTIDVGCNPHTGLEVSPETLRHEMGHFWLMSNHRIYNHDHRFRNCFAGWVDPRVKSMVFVTEDGDIVHVDYISHVDYEDLNN